MTNGFKEYDKELCSFLQCSWKAKKQLLSHWKSQRQALLEDISPSYEELVSSFGPPEEMAKILMEEVPPSKFRTNKYKSFYSVHFLSHLL